MVNRGKARGEGHVEWDHRAIALRHIGRDGVALDPGLRFRRPENPNDQGDDSASTLTLVPRYPRRQWRLAWALVLPARSRLVCNHRLKTSLKGRARRQPWLQTLQAGASNAASRDKLSHRSHLAKPAKATNLAKPRASRDRQFYLVRYSLDLSIGRIKEVYSWRGILLTSTRAYRIHQGQMGCPAE